MLHNNIVIIVKIIYLVCYKLFDWKSNILNNMLLQVDQASLGISREYLSKGFGEKIVDAYYSYLVDIAVILGADPERASKEIRESVEFEMKLANVSLLTVI